MGAYRYYLCEAILKQKAGYSVACETYGAPVALIWVVQPWLYWFLTIKNGIPWIQTLSLWVQHFIVAADVPSLTRISLDFFKALSVQNGAHQRLHQCVA